MRKLYISCSSLFWFIKSLITNFIVCAKSEFESAIDWPWQTRHLKFFKILISFCSKSFAKTIWFDKKKNSIIFLEELGNPYYFLAEDKNGKVSVKLGIYGVPESILVDKNFTIIKKFIGPINSSDYNDIIKIIKN